MRRVLVVMLVGLILGSSAAPALAQTGGDLGNQVVLSGRVDLASGERSGSVVVFHGPVRIEGDVRGSVVVFDGSAFISGNVRDNVIVFNGPASIQATAVIGGDLVTRRRASIAQGATIRGDTKRVNATFTGWQSRFVARLGFWLAFSLSTLILGLLLLALAPRGMDAAALVGRSRVGASIGWGAILFFGLPILALLVMVTIVGIPLGLSVLLALWLLYTVGYTTSAWLLGRTVVKPPRGRFVAFLAGWGILRVVALIPFLAGIAWLLATILGLGALAVAAWRSRRATAIPPAPAAVAPAVG